MAVVLNQNFTGTDGSAFVGQGVFSNVAGTAPTYKDTANAGVSALRFPAAVQSIIGTSTYTGTTVRTFSRIWKLSAAPTATQCEVLQVRVGAARGVGLAIRATGLVRILNNDGTTSMGSTTNTVPIGTEFRVTWTINGTAVSFSFYPNTTSTTPTETIGPFTSSGQGSITTERDGFITSTGLGAGITLDISWPVDADNTTDPGPRSYVAVAPSMPVDAITDSTGWTAYNGSSILANISDGALTTGMRSGNNPVNQQIRMSVPPLVGVPTTDLYVNLRGFRDSGSSSTVTALLYEGTTLRATSSAITTLGTTDTAAVATFPIASLSAVTPSAWTAGTLELRLNVTAA